MSTLLEIEKAIESLPARDFRELHRWVSERSFREWDEEITADAAAGKFDGLRRRIRTDYEAGKCTDL